MVRTRGRAMQAHVDACVALTWMPAWHLRGARMSSSWQVFGPRVSGPRQDDWGGNTFS